MGGDGGGPEGRSSVGHVTNQLKPRANRRDTSLVIHWANACDAGPLLRTRWANIRGAYPWYSQKWPSAFSFLGIAEEGVPAAVACQDKQQ